MENDLGQMVGLIRSGVEVWAASLEQGRGLLLTPDECVNAQSPFDRNARIGLPQETFEVDEGMYLAFLTTQVLPWTSHELAALKRIIPSLRPAFEALPHQLPQKVWLIRTTGREEGAAAYTKHHDTIVLPANMVESVKARDAGGDPLHPGFTDDFLAGVITHEFFHLLSKNNPQSRKAWYATVGYYELPNPVELPGTSHAKGSRRDFTIAELKITNPDAPLINVAIDLAPEPDAREIPLAPALVSSAPYTGGAFFDTLEWIFLEIEIEGGRARIRTGSDGPSIYKASALMEQYRKKIGYYLSGELFHPDELLAQSFAKVAGEFQPPVLERIAKNIWPHWSV